MRHHVILLASVCFIVATSVKGNPLPANDQELDVLQIPLGNGKEIDVLTLGSKSQEQAIAERNKRTIGLLRELFPDITKQVDAIVNRIIAQVIRVAGPSLLPALLGSNRPTTARTDSDFNSSDFDDVKSDDDDGDDGNGDGDVKGATGTRVQIELRTFAPDSNEATQTTTGTAMIADDDDARKNGASETQIDLQAINKQLEETIRVARQVKEAEAAAQAVANLQEQQKQQQQQQKKQQQQQSESAASQQPQLEQSIQLNFNNEVLNSNENAKPVSNDLQSSESKSPAIDDLSLDSNEDQVDLDDRNKRFLALGGGGGLAGSASGTNANVNAGGAAGSGNFLFDIVRLFSGSVQTQNRDQAANSPKNTIGAGGSSDDSDASAAADGYTEGIPGPVTRLVVLANRGLANLVQDMILRVAATSEKFVNFNAKLITALI